MTTVIAGWTRRARAVESGGHGEAGFAEAARVSPRIPHAGWRLTRVTVALVMTLALVVAGLEMIEPLFMRFIIDRVLLERGA